MAQDLLRTRDAPRKVEGAASARATARRNRCRARRRWRDKAARQYGTGYFYIMNLSPEAPGPARDARAAGALRLATAAQRRATRFSGQALRMLERMPLNRSAGAVAPSRHVRSAGATHR